MPRRAVALGDPGDTAALDAAEIGAFETLDRVYRAMCAILYNYVPTSGHPGGSISSGRIVGGLLFDAMSYDLSRPDRQDADVVSYAAGHKAMGLYAMFAIRDELARQGAPALLAGTDRGRLRLEDLLGFRTNPTARRPLAVAHRAKYLDGHPTPATPFVRTATGASGVGLAGAVGLALAARDHFGADAPVVQVLEGEGGLTPGRVGEALAAAGTASLGNLVVHVDFNQASIDSDKVCRDEDGPGDYVQWTPAELFALHDWNVLEVADGHDVAAVLGAQRRAGALRTGQPTAVVYRTRKGWRYGIEGRASHGAGHSLCSAGFYDALSALGDPDELGASFPTCDPIDRACAGPLGADVREACLYDSLLAVRRYLERHEGDVAVLAGRLSEARERLERAGRSPRRGAPRVEAAYEFAERHRGEAPEALRVQPGTVVSLRETLGRSLGALNVASEGGILTASADLMGSTSASLVAEGFDPGFFNAGSNPMSRQLSVGGICEDAIAGVLAGVAAFGTAIGVGSSYGAFMAPLGHVAARLHAIGAQSREEVDGVAFATLVLVCGHAGLATGEDGPTHADPQALQLLADNFPAGAAVTLTPWEPQELWPLLATALAQRPAVLAPFVPRPGWAVPDRAALGLAPATAAVDGVYLLRAPAAEPDVVVILQEAAVTNVFVTDVLPRLALEGIDAAVYYVASPELFDGLSPERRRDVLPEAHARRAMGITGFTMATMYRWILSEAGRDATLHPFRDRGYAGSGAGPSVLDQAGLGPDDQFLAIRKYLEAAS